MKITSGIVTSVAFTVLIVLIVAYNRENFSEILPSRESKTITVVPETYRYMAEAIRVDNVISIQSALDTARPGDTVVLSPGVYMQDVKTVRSGTRRAPITIKGPRTAIIKGAGSPAILDIVHDYVHVEGITIDGFAGDNEESRASHRQTLIRTNASIPLKNVTFTNVTLKSLSSQCIETGMSNRVFFEKSDIDARCGSEITQKMTLNKRLSIDDTTRKSLLAQAESIPSITIAAVGQALIKIDPRLNWQNPYGSVKPILAAADVGFTNFEMSVDTYSSLPSNYQVLTGTPDVRSAAGGNTSGPHAVKKSIMEFLSSINFKLMSLANNHAWDLGDNGVRATIDAANEYGVTHAGTGMNLNEASNPVYLTVKGVKIALISLTTSRDERLILPTATSPGVNGVWTGYPEDWDRALGAVRTGKANSDFVIFYQHYQIDPSDIEGQDNNDHRDVNMTLAAWQDSFARAVIDAGAGAYIAHGERVFSGLKIYKGAPIFYQLGGFAYQGNDPQPGHYDTWTWRGLVANLKVENRAVKSIEFVPLLLDEGASYYTSSTALQTLAKRGFAQAAA